MRQLAAIFPQIEYPDVLIGLGQPDDAAVYRLDDERVLIQTTDFFTPIVDDPWLYGAIAAANSMSDVYAMGGEVRVCLNIAGFPEDLPAEVISEILAGGAAKVQEADAAIAGGHTVTNPEPFYGLSVTGIASTRSLFRKGSAAAGDHLVLTKPLGTGIVTTAAKLTGEGESPAARQARRALGKPDLEPSHLHSAISSMTRLNRAAANAGRAAGVHSGTDITGYGLLGHAVEMATASAAAAPVRLQIESERVPALPGAFEYIGAGYLTRGSLRNPEHFGANVALAASVTAARRTLLWEAETSGGLLLAVPPAGLGRFRSICEGEEQPYWEIGVVLPAQADQPVIELL